MPRRSSAFLVAILLLSGPATAPRAQPAASAQPPVAAIVHTTLTSAPRQIRQFAFDGDPDSYFASKDNAGAADHFTLVFDKPVAVKAVAVTTGKPKGGDALDVGTLEVSVDGKKFEPLVPFTDGVARAKPDGRKVQAIRIKPGKDLEHPLAIREFAIESDPPVADFKYPIEIAVDVSDAPEMKDWAEKAARVCERQYPMICEELRSDGYKPRNMITMRLRNDYQGVAAAGGGRITGSVKFFQAHPDDIGAMVHETVHCVQQYRTGNNPGWLVEGIADYIRFFKYEPGKLRPLNPERARYNGSYKVTAAFLAYVTDMYDQELVRKLNKVMREGEYKEEIWKTLTKKTLQELDEEWRASMRP
jgi:Peptidase of plants and bacteria